MATPCLNAHEMTYIKHQTIFRINNAILYGMFCVMHDMRLLMLTTQVPIDSLTPATPSVKNQSLMFHLMTLTIEQPSNFNLSNPVCLFGLRISGVSPQSLQRLSTLSRIFIAGYICLIKNKIGSFTLGGWGGGGGESTPSCFTQTNKIYYYYYFIQL